MSKAARIDRKMWSKVYTYDEWMEAQDIPIYRGYYIEDLRTLRLGWWDLRRCHAAFIFVAIVRPARCNFGHNIARPANPRRRDSPGGERVTPAGRLPPTFRRPRTGVCNSAWSPPADPACPATLPPGRRASSAGTPDTGRSPVRVSNGSALANRARG